MSNLDPSDNKGKAVKDPEGHVEIKWLSNSQEGSISCRRDDLLHKVRVDITRQLLGITEASPSPFSSDIPFYILDVNMDDAYRLRLEENLLGDLQNRHGQPLGTIRDRWPDDPPQSHFHLFFDVSPSDDRIFKIYTTGAPSDRAVPEKFAELQAHPEGPLLLCNRPSTSDSLPVTLMLDVFGSFQDECNRGQPTREGYALAAELSQEMRKFFASEESRAIRFREVMARHGIDLSAGGVSGKGYLTDGHAMVDKYVYLMTECRNEISSRTPAEPSLKSGLHYFEYLRKIKTEIEMKHPWPCLHIVYTGPFFLFLGSTFSDRVHLDVLASVPLSFHKEDQYSMTTAARAFSAVLHAVKDLKQFYEDFACPTDDGDDSEWPDLQYPCRNFFKSPQDGSLVGFQFVERLRSHRLLFSAITECTNERLLIKFVQRYSKEAHLACAELGIAPRLLGYEEIPGGWIIVVTEHIPTTEYRPYVRQAIEEEGSFFPSGETLYKNILEAVQKMHQRGFVHGDIRNVNILLRNAASSTPASPVLLCDFDWAGREGDARYPFDINREDIPRPESAVGGELITKAHDLEMAGYVSPQRPGDDL